MYQTIDMQLAIEYLFALLYVQHNMHKTVTTICQKCYWPNILVYKQYRIVLTLASVHTNIFIANVLKT